MTKGFKNCIAFATLILFGAQASPQAFAQQSRIINGKPASTSTYPWLASLFIVSESDSESGGGCGGSLIASRWILTAAHCFLNDAGNSVSTDAASRTSITLNSTNITNLSAGAIQVGAKRIIVHPNYNPDKETSANSHDFDIALIELESAVNIAPIRLYTGAIPGSVPAIVAGWGATVGDGSTPSDNLLATQLITVPENTCATAHEGSITANMFCAGGYTSTDTSDTCQGDSGGPLFVMLNDGPMQLGITSFGGSETSNCGTPGLPGVYARISQLFSFIHEHVPTANVINSLANLKLDYNTFIDATGMVAVPKVYGAGSKFAVQLRLTGIIAGAYHFELASAEELKADVMTSVPSYFDEAENVLILPLVKVGPDTFNVRLKHLGDFKFVLVAADLP
ncbi:MAG: serine protease [Pseudohongiella sp.]|nr:serine protease [Pseudohongiella sp.]